MTGVKDSGSEEGYVSQRGNFGSAVSELSSGGTLLVVSEGPPRLHSRCCRQLLGNSRERRLRVLGIAGPSGEADPLDVIDRLPDGARVSSDELRVVYNDLPTRGTATVSPNAGATESGIDPGPGVTPGGRIDPSSEVFTTLSNATLGEFGLAINDAIGTLLDGVDGDPVDGELRLCVDDVAALVDTDDVTTVAQFLTILGNRVKQKGGLFHAHASISSESEPVRTLAPFFDAVIQLRIRDGDEEMRWIMTDDAISEWFPMDWITP